MMQRFFILLLCASITLGSFGQNDFSTAKSSWYDTARMRTIAYKLYQPDTLVGTYPIIIFSHGLGGSVEAAPYLGEYLAAHGYICFFVQHPGSDESVWKHLPPGERAAALKSSLTNPANARQRFEDIPFAIKQLGVANREDPLLAGHLNLDAIGMAGHSYGAQSTLVASGQKLGGLIAAFKVPQLKAAVALSPNLPERFSGDPDRYYGNISIPMLHITGTLDGDPLRRSADFDPATRTKPYAYMHTSPQYLLVLDGANHMTFGQRNALSQATSAHQQKVQQAVTAFFDAYLKSDANSLQWLRNDYTKSLNPADKFEWKE
jgi:predicted dienelactone hydrolase